MQACVYSVRTPRVKTQKLKLTFVVVMNAHVVVGMNPDQHGIPFTFRMTQLSLDCVFRCLQYSIVFVDMAQFSHAKLFPKTFRSFLTNESNQCVAEFIVRPQVQRIQRFIQLVDQSLRFLFLALLEGSSGLVSLVSSLAAQ